MTLGGQYETLAGLPSSEKDYRQLVSDDTMLACKLLVEGQTLALRRTRANVPIIRELPHVLERNTEAIVSEELEEDEVPLVRKRRAPEAAQDPIAERAPSGAAAGPSGEGNPYPFRDFERAVADLRLVRFNLNQLVHRHPNDPDRNITLL